MACSVWRASSLELRTGCTLTIVPVALVLGTMHHLAHLILGAEFLSAGWGQKPAQSHDSGSLSKRKAGAMKTNHKKTPWLSSRRLPNTFGRSSRRRNGASTIDRSQRISVG